jgi:hypothetical protein
VAYIAATFAVRATSHFGINAEHYAQLGYVRADPIVPMLERFSNAATCTALRIG